MDKTRILVIDDDRGHAEATAETLERAGHACVIATSGNEGAHRIDTEAFDLVITDLVMRDQNGIDMVRRARAKSPDTEVIVMTGYPSYETAIEALNEGAYDYLDKPVDLNILRAKVRKVLEKQKLVRSNIELRRQLDKKYGFEGILGQTEAMQRAFDTLQQVSRSTATVLILGESGTGKELVARAIHNNSPRRGHRFIGLNCAALQESVLESELFGHVKGSFTGAQGDHKGYFEAADKGTLLLDEIGDMPMSIQIKLLRVLEYGEIFRVGSNEPIKVNVRLVAATNKNLAALIKDGKFREDLYFRLRVVTIELPPLRDRVEDIALLASSFLKEFAETHGRHVKDITPAAMEFLYDYSWPGNIRELRNAIESMVVLARKDVLDVDDIPSYLKSPRDRAETSSSVSGVNLEEAEKENIKRALARTEGNREKAAKLLGIGERTLYRKIKRYGL